MRRLRWLRWLGCLRQMGWGGARVRLTIARHDRHAEQLFLSPPYRLLPPPLSPQLEEKLPALCALHGLGTPLSRAAASPFRAPLTSFLVKYAAEAVSYFMEPQVEGRGKGLEEGGQGNEAVVPFHLLALWEWKEGAEERKGAMGQNGGQGLACSGEGGRRIAGGVPTCRSCVPVGCDWLYHCHTSHPHSPQCVLSHTSPHSPCRGFPTPSTSHG